MRMNVTSLVCLRSWKEVGIQILREVEKINLLKEKLLTALGS